MTKKLVGLLLVVVMAFSLFGTTISAQATGQYCGYTQERATGPKVYMNGNKVLFNKDLGYPYIDRSNRTQIPFRAFSEACQFQVGWDGETRTGYAKKGDMTVTIPVDKNYITVNGKVVNSDTQNVIINGRVHLPLRIVLEAFGYNVKWDGDNGCIYIQPGDDQQQPEEPTEPEPVDPGDNNEQPVEQPTEPGDNGNEQPQEPAEPVEVSKEALRGIHIGDDVSKVTEKLGQPKRTDVSGHGFKWYIYNQAYEQYLQIGIKDNKVVALYTNASYWKLTETVRYGASTDTVKKDFGAKNDYGNQLKTTVGDMDYTFYVDQYDNNKVVAVLMMTKGVKSKGYYVQSSAELRTSYEYEVFDLTNVERVNKGLEPYKWRDDLAKVARDHSKDMIANNYFSHTNKQGQAPWDRAKQAGISYSYFSENIAYGQKDAMHVVNGWMNSSGHRRSILSTDCTGLGVGVWFKSDNTPYYTQNFIKD